MEKRRIIHIRKSFLDEDCLWHYILKSLNWHSSSNETTDLTGFKKKIYCFFCVCKVTWSHFVVYIFIILLFVIFTHLLYYLLICIVQLLEIFICQNSHTCVRPKPHSRHLNTSALCQGSISQKVVSLRLIVSVISKLLIGWNSHLRLILDLQLFVKSTTGIQAWTTSALCQVFKWSHYLSWA